MQTTTSSGTLLGGLPEAPPAGAPAAAPEGTAPTSAEKPAAAGPATTTPPPAEPQGADATAKEQQKDAQQQSKDGTQKGAEPEPKEGEPAKATEPPNKLEVKLPEGVTPNPKLLGALETLAKAHGLNAEQVQPLADAYVEALNEQAEAVAQDFQKAKAAWVEQVRNDPEFGGEKFEKSLRMGERALQKLDPDGSLAALLKRTELAYEPSVVRAFMRAGLLMGEDTIATEGPTHGSSPSTEPDIKELAARLYPNTKF